MNRRLRDLTPDLRTEVESFLYRPNVTGITPQQRQYLNEQRRRNIAQKYPGIFSDNEDERYNAYLSIAKSNDKEVMRYLLEQGENINWVDIMERIVLENPPGATTVLQTILEFLIGDITAISKAFQRQNQGTTTIEDDIFIKRWNDLVKEEQLPDLFELGDRSIRREYLDISIWILETIASIYGASSLYPIIETAVSTSNFELLTWIINSRYVVDIEWSRHAVKLLYKYQFRKQWPRAQQVIRELIEKNLLDWEVFLTRYNDEIRPTQEIREFIIQLIDEYNLTQVDSEGRVIDI